MNAPTPAQAAARRLQCADLTRRTHVRKAPPPKLEGAPAHMTPEKIQRIRELDGKMARRDICDLLKISHVTVRRYLGRAKPKKPKPGLW